jgi:simple sugar transport system ATP-binding protein
MITDTTFHHGATAAMAPIVEMKNIEKHFGNITALAGVSFDGRPGECHRLLGDNGAGKSTFIWTMSGVHKPTKGRGPFRQFDVDHARGTARPHGRRTGDGAT